VGLPTSRLRRPAGAAAKADPRLAAIVQEAGGARSAGGADHRRRRGGPGRLFAACEPLWPRDRPVPGTLANERVLGILEKSDVLILPRRRRSADQPVEGHGARLRPVVTDVGSGIPEVVQEGVTPATGACGDIAAFADGCRSCSGSSPARRNGLRRTMRYARGLLPGGHGGEIRGPVPAGAAEAASHAYDRPPGGVCCRRVMRGRNRLPLPAEALRGLAGRLRRKRSE